MNRSLCRILSIALSAALLLSGCGRVAMGTEETGGAASSSSSNPDRVEGGVTGAASGTLPEQTEGEPVQLEPQVIVSETVEENRTDGDGRELLRFRYNTVTVSIPGCEGAAEAIQADLDGQLAELAAYAEQLVEFRQEDAFYDWEYTLEGTFTLTRADSGVVSLMYCQSEYTGGAHGGTNYFGFTYDTATGQRLTLSALGASLKRTADGLCQSLAQQVETEREGFFFEDYLAGVSSSVVTDDTFWMTETGMVFVDNEYVLQPYAGGTLHFFLPYSALEEVLEPAYLLPVEGEQASVTLSDGSCYTLEAEQD